MTKNRCRSVQLTFVLIAADQATTNAVISNIHVWANDPQMASSVLGVTVLAPVQIEARSPPLHKQEKLHQHASLSLCKDTLLVCTDYPGCGSRGSEYWYCARCKQCRI